VESLDSIFKGKEAPVVEQQKAEAPVEVRAETPTETEQQRAERDERGRFKAKEQEAQTPAKPEAPKAAEAPKVDTKPAPTAAEKAKPVEKPHEAEQALDPRHKAAIAQANDERRKRQALEQELARYRAQQQKAPDVATDPQGFQQHINETLQTQTINMRVDLSAAMARKQYQDYEAVMAEWPALIEQNPYLYQQAIQQELPADWAYNYVKQQKLLQEIGDPAKWREAEQARIRAELEAELAQKAQQAPARPAAPVPPPSLANATSAAGGISTKAQWNGPTPFQNMIRR
jgi:hypothetical protein